MLYGLVNIFPKISLMPLKKFRDIVIFFFIVGTSAVVYPAASLIFTAKQNGAYLAEINIEETEISGLADISFFGASGKILPEILDEMKTALL